MDQSLFGHGKVWPGHEPTKHDQAKCGLLWTNEELSWQVGPGHGQMKLGRGKTRAACAALAGGQIRAAGCRNGEAVEQQK